MKKSLKITAFILLVFNINIFAQKDSIHIVRIADDMSDEEYFLPSFKLIAATPDKKKGFSTSAFLDKKGDDIVVTGIKCVMVNIGSCVENNELIIMFEDESKIKLVSWNKFNCDGDAWFKITDDERYKLENFKIKKIRIQNGRTFDSYTHEITEDKDYFNQLFYACKSKKIKNRTK